MNKPDATGLSLKLARWASELRFEDLPAATVEAAKVRLLDMFAVAWAGADADGIEPLRSLLVDQGGRVDATVIAYGDKLPASAAALINGTMAGALDFDGLHERSGVHSDIAVIPAAMALAERHGADGRELITAIAAGEEILIRLGLSSGTGPGWFFSSVLGVFAAAVAAGRIMKLDPQTMNAALGVAFCHATGSQQNLVENALTKRLQGGLAAEAGVRAAEMAMAGIAGPLQSIEGKFGLATLFAPIDPAVVLAELGATWHMDELTLKKYPCCFCSHAGIEAALELAGRQGFRTADVAAIVATVPPFSERLVGEPFDAGTATQVSAQFSLPYAIACALERRRFDLDDIEPAQIRDAEVARLAGRVRVEAETGNPARFTPVRLVIEMHGGGRFETVTDRLPGTPKHPLDDDEMRDKVFGCFGRGARPLSGAASEALTERIMSLEKLSDVAAMYGSANRVGSRS